jgi:hypothetical protein
MKLLAITLLLCVAGSVDAQAGPPVAENDF